MKVTTHPHWANEGLVISGKPTSLPWLSVWLGERIMDRHSPRKSFMKAFSWTSRPKSPTFHKKILVQNDNMELKLLDFHKMFNFHHYNFLIFCTSTRLFPHVEELYAVETRSAWWILLDFMSREFPLLWLYCVFYSISSRQSFVNNFKFLTLLFVKT